MTLITTAQIQHELRPGLNMCFADYMTYPDQWRDIFQYNTSQMAQEYDQEMQLLGIAGFKSEGGPVLYDTMQEKYTTSYSHRYAGIGFMMSRAAILDNLYEKYWPQGARSVRASLSAFKNIQGANVLNNGFNSAYPVSDGQALYSTTHPTNGGNIANTIAIPTDLSETSLEQLCILIEFYQSASGILDAYHAEKMIVSPYSKFTAERILGTEGRTSTGDNDINAIRAMRYLTKGYAVNNYLGSQKGFYLITDCPEGFKYFNREDIVVNIFTDPSTGNVNFASMERYSFGNSNWRSTAATQGTI